MNEPFVYNPRGIDHSFLPYVIGFNNSGHKYGDMVGVAVSEDGEFLSSHVSSNESFSIHDIGTYGGNEYHHEKYREHYPDGYRMVYVEFEDRDGSELLQKALAANTKKTLDPDFAYARGKHDRARGKTLNENPYLALEPELEANKKWTEGWLATE